MLIGSESFYGKTDMTDDQKKKVLVMDDEADMRTFVSTVLKISGYVSLAAEDGEKGLELARLEEPDLVILDVMMPGIEDGIRCYHAFKAGKDTRQIPIIMLSAIARKTFFHAISRLHLPDGASLSEPDAYMEKPPDADGLAVLVSDVLGE
jgi:CheY-like chemotaxis protein